MHYYTLMLLPVSSYTKQGRDFGRVSHFLLAVRHESHISIIISAARSFVELRFRFRMRTKPR